MSGARARANHARYMAVLQLEAWAWQLSLGQRPDWVIATAFAPAVQLHLTAAYGWLILDAAQVAKLPDMPPRSVNDLPGRAPGLGWSVELNHCLALEHSGWLSELLTPMPGDPAAASGASTLLASTGGVPDRARCQRWLVEFDALCAAVDATSTEC